MLFFKRNYAPLIALACCLGLGLSTSTSSAQPLPGRRAAVTQDDYRAHRARARYQEAYFALLRSLEKIEAVNARARGRRARARIQRLVDRARAQAQELATPPPRPHRMSGRPMKRERFRRLLHSAHHAPTRVALLDIVHRAAERSWFTVDQVISLMAAARSDRARVRIGTLTYPKVVDPDQWFRVYACLTFRSSRRELARATEQAAPPWPVRNERWSLTAPERPVAWR